MAASIPRRGDAALPRVASRTPPARATIEELFAAHVAFVWRSLRDLGVDSADLDDQTQEVFLVAHRHLARWDGAHPRAWLYAIVRRRAAAHRRRSHRRHERPVARIPENADTRDPSARAEIDFLNRVLDSLDEEKRAAFLLYEVEGMSLREVAATVGCSIPTAYARYLAARRDLARALEERRTPAT